MMKIMMGPRLGFFFSLFGGLENDMMMSMIRV